MTSSPPSSVLLSTVWPWLSFASKIVGGLLLTLVAVVYYNQDRLLYFPNPPNFPKTPEENPYGCMSPANWRKDGLLQRNKGKDSAGSATPSDSSIPYEEAMVTTADGAKLHTWLMLQDNPEMHPTLIYFHGNAGNMVNVLLFDAR